MASGWNNPENEVYPRPRGGTVSLVTATISARGLSPPTRGNRITSARITGLTRSIPAHAGEPVNPPVGDGNERVYPRPRGGTGQGFLRVRRHAGLSPPTRGNPSHLFCHVNRRGSIPAHAGEPGFPSVVCGTDWVYPRPRGGTPRNSSSVVNTPGLSPPTRGNLAKGRPVCRLAGSIPAHAGEPRHGVRRGRGRAVYPRPRGGTAAIPRSRRTS